MRKPNQLYKNYFNPILGNFVNFDITQINSL